MMVYTHTCTGQCSWPHPLPPSPIEGEVQTGGFDEIVPLIPNGTSPLVGKVGRGDLSSFVRK